MLLVKILQTNILHMFKQLEVGNQIIRIDTQDLNTITKAYFFNEENNLIKLDQTLNYLNLKSLSNPKTIIF